MNRGLWAIPQPSQYYLQTIPDNHSAALFYLLL